MQIILLKQHCHTVQQLRLTITRQNQTLTILNNLHFIHSKNMILLYESICFIYQVVSTFWERQYFYENAFISSLKQTNKQILCKISYCKRQTVTNKSILIQNIYFCNFMPKMMRLQLIIYLNSFKSIKFFIRNDAIKSRAEMYFKKTSKTLGWHKFVH